VNIKKLVHQFDEARRLEKQYATLKTELREKLKQAMEEFGMDKVTTEDGLTAYLADPRIFAGCSKDDRDALHAWLRETGRDDVIKESVNANTLSAMIKEMIIEKQEVPEFITINTDKVVNVRKS